MGSRPAEETFWVGCAPSSSLPWSLRQSRLDLVFLLFPSLVQSSGYIETLHG